MTKRLSLYDVEKRLLEDGRGIKIVGAYVSAHAHTVFQCQHGHQWMASANHVARGGSGCPKCAGQYKPSTKEFREWLMVDGRGMTLIGEYVNKSTATLFQCHQGHQWEAIPNNIKLGRGCPTCATFGFDPDKEAVVYGWTRNNYLKVGITNDLPRRLNEHRKYGEINMVYERHYSVGRDARDWERAFKQKHTGSYATRDECPDGHTETFPLHLLEQLIEEKL